jgi:hypothetical protein
MFRISEYITNEICFYHYKILKLNMGLNRNVVLVVVALTMTFAMWMMPESISAETQQKRLLQLTNYATNPNRLPGVGKFCQGVTRADLINDEEKATA